MVVGLAGLLAIDAIVLLLLKVALVGGLVGPVAWILAATTKDLSGPNPENVHVLQGPRQPATLLAVLSLAAPDAEMLDSWGGPLPR